MASSPIDPGWSTVPARGRPVVAAPSSSQGSRALVIGGTVAVPGPDYPPPTRRIASARRSWASPDFARRFDPSVASWSGRTGATPGGSSTLTSGARPTCQADRPAGVSHSDVPIERMDPSLSGKSVISVPVPVVVVPTSVARWASCSAPATISAQLAESASTRTTSGRRVGVASCRDRHRDLSMIGTTLAEDDLARAEEDGRDADGLVLPATGVSAQVEDQAGRAGRGRSVDRRPDLDGAPLREDGQADQRGLRAGHQGPRRRPAARSRRPSSRVPGPRRRPRRA